MHTPWQLRLGSWRASLAQLWTGGLREYATAHRYVGSLGLLGMILAASNELKYVSAASGLGNFYTLLLCFGAAANMILGVLRARQRRLAKHKDHMLMAVMFTLDPAIHRLVMWTIRLFASDSKSLDPMVLLIFGKMPPLASCSSEPVAELRHSNQQQLQLHCLHRGRHPCCCQSGIRRTWHEYSRREYLGSCHPGRHLHIGSCLCARPYGDAAQGQHAHESVILVALGEAFFCSTLFLCTATPISPNKALIGRQSWSR